MRKLYEIFKFLKVQKRIVFAETIRGNTVFNSFPVSSMQIVVMISILLNGLITEVLGRKKSFILGQTIILMAWVIIYFAPSFAVLITGRSIMGVGIGLIYPIGAIYLAEISLVSYKSRVLLQRQILNVNYHVKCSSDKSQ